VAFYARRGKSIANSPAGKAIREALFEAVFEAVFEAAYHALGDPAVIRQIIEDALAAIPAEDFPAVMYDLQPDDHEPVE